MVFIKNNFLVLIFILLQIIFIIPVAFEGFLYKGVNVAPAVLFHIILTLLLFIGYMLTKQSFNNCYGLGTPIVEYVHNIFLIGIVIVVIFGVFCSAMSVQKIISLSDYFKILISGTNSELLKVIKHKVGTEGLPGYMKVFGYAPLAVFLVISSYLNFFKFADVYIKKKFTLIAIISCVGTLAKTFFTMDRLPILAVLLVSLYSFIFYKSKKKKSHILLFFILFSGIILLLKFITSSKMDGMKIGHFLPLYFNLGIANFQLNIQNYNDWSYGLNSFFTPWYFIGKTFGYSIYIPGATDSFWGGPQYFYSYLYMDFGYGVFLVVFLLGNILGFYQNLILNRNKTGLSFYFIVLFSLCTTVVIPISRTVELWLMIFICVILIRMIRFSKNKFTST